MNDYRVVALLKNGKALDLTDALESLKWEDNEGELAQRAVIALAQVQTAYGLLSSVIELCSTIYIYGNGSEVMRGIVWEWQYTSSSQNKFQVLVYDKMIYLQKSKDNFYFASGRLTKSILTEICNKWNIKLSYKWGNYKHGKLVYKGKTIAKSILDTLDEVKKKTGKRYVAKFSKDTLIIDFPGTNKYMYIISSENGNAIATDHTQTMDKMITRVVITGKDTSKGKIPVVATVNGNRNYGCLQDLVSSSSTSTSEAKEEANAKIKEYGSPENVIKVEAVDVPEIRKGDVVNVVAGSLNGDYFVLSISHDADGQTMSMKLEKAVAS